MAEQASRVATELQQGGYEPICLPSIVYKPKPYISNIATPSSPWIYVEVTVS